MRIRKRKSEKQKSEVPLIIASAGTGRISPINYQCLAQLMGVDGSDDEATKLFARYITMVEFHIALKEMYIEGMIDESLPEL